VRLSSWRSDWNGERLHSSLDYVTPNEFAARWEKKPKTDRRPRHNLDHRMGADHS